MGSSGGTGASGASGGSGGTAGDEPVAYMPYTVHNQSTSDILVMAASRDKTITVPKGTGMTFTPYVAEPLLFKDWSWTYASERAPRARQGFPFLTTYRLNVNTYQIQVTGSPTSGSFRLIHDGHVTSSIKIEVSAETTADKIRVALASLDSIQNFSVTPSPDSATNFTVVIINDCGTLMPYSYRLFNGDSPEVQVTLENSDSTLLTRWAVFEPEPKPAAPSAASSFPAPVTDVVDIPSGLPEIIAQFVKAIKAVSDRVIAIGQGVVSTVTDIIGKAVYLITGKEVEDTDGRVRSQVTDFLQKLAADDGVSEDAATSFENILRRITGGTGLTGTATVPTPINFVTNAVNAVENFIETLAEWLQKILHAIIGK